MTAPVEVYAAESIRSVADAVLASLPLSFSPGRSVSGAVAVIGGSEDWPSAVADALDEGAVGVIVVGPQPADAEGLRARSGRPIALDSRWSANPVVESAARTVAASPAPRWADRVPGAGSASAPRLMRPCLIS